MHIHIVHTLVVPMDIADVQLYWYASSGSFHIRRLVLISDGSTPHLNTYLPYPSLSSEDISPHFFTIAPIQSTGLKKIYGFGYLLVGEMLFSVRTCDEDEPEVRDNELAYMQLEIFVAVPVSDNESYRSLAGEEKAAECLS